MVKTCLVLLGVSLVATTSVSGRVQSTGAAKKNPCKPAFASPEVTTSFSDIFCEPPEFVKLPLPVTRGAIPDWMLGTLYRNVPAQFNFGEDQVEHLFDAMGQLQAFHFENGTHAYVESKFMKTRSYVTMNEEQAFSWIGAYTYPFPGPAFPGNGTSSSSTRSKKQQPKQTDKKKKEHAHWAENNDVSLLYLGGRYFSITDAPTLFEWNASTLDTLTPNMCQWNDTLSAQSSPTHGQMDMHTKEYFNVVGNAHDDLFGPNKHANFTFWKANSTALKETDPSRWGRTVVGSVETGNLSYTHSLGLTRRNVVWMENPLYFDLVDILLSKPPIRSLVRDGKDKVPMRMHAVDRKTGEHKVASVPGFGCMIHTGNTFEDEAAGTITYDTVRFPDCNIYDALETIKILSKLEEATAIVSNAYLFRCVMNLTDETASCTEIIPDNVQGFPWWNKQFHMRPYRYAYTTSTWGASNPQGMSTGVLKKVDVLQGKVVQNFTKPGYVFTEAIFVPKNRSLCTFGEDTGACAPTAEDEGALMSVVFNTIENRSEIWALDARDFSTLFEIDLPFTVPFHFHGIFCGLESERDSTGDRFCLWN